MQPFSALAKKLRSHLDSDFDLPRLLASLTTRSITVDARRELDFGSRRNRAYLIDDGWACTYKILRNGTRQIVDVGIPGDFIGARTLLFRSRDYSGSSLTRAVLYEISPRMLEATYQLSPKAGGALLWAISQDQSILSERLVDLGRRTALERVAHYILELEYRLGAIGSSGGGHFVCPLSQTLLADVLGLTPIHLNRVMRELREQNLISYGEGRVTILDRERLADLSSFDARYLDGPGLDPER